MSEEPAMTFHQHYSNYYCMLIVWKLAKVFISPLLFEPSWKTRMHSVDLVRSSWKWRCTNFLCWMPVIIIASMVTSSPSQLCPRWSNTCADRQSSLFDYCSHDNFQSSLLSPWWLPLILWLGPRWSNICADCHLVSVIIIIPWWLPVIITNAVWGIPW